MAASEEQAQKLTFRKYEEGDSQWQDFKKQIFNEDNSHKCPTYVHRTPPCQGSCPSGEDIRGWLQIVRGMEHPPEGMTWQEYAFRRATDANPFPAMMGRVCPAPCESGCNRNNVDDFVGINSVEQFIGDTAFDEGFQFETAPDVCDKRVAIVGGGRLDLLALISFGGWVTHQPFLNRRKNWAVCFAMVFPVIERHESDWIARLIEF